MPRVPEYKQITHPQLRSFCEVARHATMRAAAEKLRVAQPTVWKQVRALERSLGVSLIESHRRGTRLTREGEMLLEVCAPAVHEIDRVGERFHEQLRGLRRRVVVATTPRVFTDELPDCLAELEKALPRVELVFLEVSSPEVIPGVESGEVDVGLANVRASSMEEQLDAALCYQIDPVLVVPRGHPLARKRRLALEDLARHPLLNARDSFPIPGVDSALHQVGAYDHPDRRFELLFAQTIERYARLDLGIGLVGRARGHRRRAPEGIVEKRLDHLLPSMPVHAISRRQLTPDPVVETLAGVLRGKLG